MKSSNIMLSIIMMIVALFAARTIASNYCTIKSCISRSHTMCKYSSPLGPKCNKASDIGLTQKEKTAIVNKHNELRRRVASGLELRGKPGPQPPAAYMPDLKWDSELEEIAQRWANQCTFGHDQCRNVDSYTVGQNVGVTLTSGENASNVADMVLNWYNEVKNFDKNNVSEWDPTNFEDVGHYSQLVWANTTHIGCGRIKYISNGWNNQFLVCNYGPSGNSKKQAVYQKKKLLPLIL